jgi:hypothetical protein
VAGDTAAGVFYRQFGSDDFTSRHTLRIKSRRGELSRTRDFIRLADGVALATGRSTDVSSNRGSDTASSEKAIELVAATIAYGSEEERLACGNVDSKAPRDHRAAPTAPCGNVAARVRSLQAHPFQELQALRAKTA